MNKIYDIVLNFQEIEERYDYYEWRREDSITYIDTIPIIRISSKDMEMILTHHIKVSKPFLKKIENKTISINGPIPFCTLITDMVRVYAFSFDKEGFLKKTSSLIGEEEDSILKEIELEEEKIIYQLLEKKNPLLFLTRKERNTQKQLLREIDMIYEKKEYEFIHYLYCELSMKKRSREEEYQFLMQSLKNKYRESYQRIYEIIQLLEKEKRTN